MLTQSNIIQELQNISTSPLLLGYMIRSKQSIQLEILPLLTDCNRDNIRASNFDQDVFDKLIANGKDHYYKSNKSDEFVLCLAMAIGTIIKEYEWGLKYVMPEGLCKIINLIRE